MAGVPHDLLIGHAVPVGRRDDPRPHAAWRDRFEQSALDSGRRGAFEEDLADGVRVQPLLSDRAPLGNAPKDRAASDLRGIQPSAHGADGAGFCRAAENEQTI